MYGHNINLLPDCVEADVSTTLNKLCREHFSASVSAASPVQLDVDVDIDAYVFSRDSGSAESTAGKSKDRRHKKPRNSGKRNFTIGVEVMAHTSTGCILNGNGFRQGADESAGDPNSARIILRDILQEAVDKLVAVVRSGACVDEHTGDQLLVYMALCNGQSCIKVEPRSERSSLHIETAIRVCNVFAGFDRFELSTDATDGCRTITCREVVSDSNVTL